MRSLRTVFVDTGRRRPFPHQGMPCGAPNKLGNFQCLGTIKTRSFSDQSQSTSHAFDRNLKRMQRDNAARTHKLWKGGDDVVDYDYLRQEMAFRLVDRLDDIKREEGFPLALDIGTFMKLGTSFPGVASTYASKSFYFIGSSQVPVLGLFIERFVQMMPLMERVGLVGSES
jgi:hypothetical protein